MVQYYDDFSQKKKKKLSHKASLACSGSVTSRYLDTQLGLKEAVIEVHVLTDQYGTQEQELRVMKWTSLFETQDMGVDKLIMLTYLLSLHLKFSSRDAHNVDDNVAQRSQRRSFRSEPRCTSEATKPLSCSHPPSIDLPSHPRF
ncbi:Uncharacterized protein HZ326_15696 [Fusarium oxysporum f. sp. albedinis]|nr:Uncharacterized protein HZ326_15696 [Fusarium oxysporum f. sp. albedinis]